MADERQEYHEPEWPQSSVQITPAPATLHRTSVSEGATFDLSHSTRGNVEQPRNRVPSKDSRYTETLRQSSNREQTNYDYAPTAQLERHGYSDNSVPTPAATTGQYGDPRARSKSPAKGSPKGPKGRKIRAASMGPSAFNLAFSKSKTDLGIEEAALEVPPIPDTKAIKKPARQRSISNLKARINARKGSQELEEKKLADRELAGKSQGQSQSGYTQEPPAAAAQSNNDVAGKQLPQLPIESILHHHNYEQSHRRKSSAVESIPEEPAPWPLPYAPRPIDTSFAQVPARKPVKSMYLEDETELPPPPRASALLDRALGAHVQSPVATEMRVALTKISTGPGSTPLEFISPKSGRVKVAVQEIQQRSPKEAECGRQSGSDQKVESRDVSLVHNDDNTAGDEEPISPLLAIISPSPSRRPPAVPPPTTDLPALPQRTTSLSNGKQTEEAPIVSAKRSWSIPNPLSPTTIDFALQKIPGRLSSNSWATSADLQAAHDQIFGLESRLAQMERERDRAIDQRNKWWRVAQSAMHCFKKQQAEQAVVLVQYRELWEEVSKGSKAASG